MSKFIAGQQVKVTTWNAGAEYHDRIGKVESVNPEEDYPIDVVFSDQEDDCLSFTEGELESADVEVGI